MNDPTFPKLLDMIQSAVDLAQSLSDDIKSKQSRVSKETVLKLNAFQKRHDDLSQILDLMAVPDDREGMQ